MAIRYATPDVAGDDAQFFHWANDLAARHNRFSTRNLDEACRHLSGLSDCIALHVEDAADFLSYQEVVLQLGGLMLTMGCVDARNGYELHFRSGDEYLITIPLRGSGWVSTGDLFVEYGRGDVMIVGPSCPVVKHWEGAGQVVTLHVPADRFRSAVAEARRGALHDAPIVSIGTRRLHSFLRLIDAVCADLHDTLGRSPFTRSPLAERVEELLIALLIDELAPGDAAAPSATAAGSPAIPYYVRRAEEFITSNAHRDIGIGEIAGAAGVSLRTIQYGFRRFRDTTPMLHLKQVRYDRARTLLLASGGDKRRISDVAAEVGYVNISQFSRDYRAMFGESPSQTFANPRRLGR